MVASAEQNIRGIDIDKLAKGFADEALVLRRFVTVSKTKAREIRWYKKTAGFLDSVDTTAITASQIANTSSKSLPVVVEQSWTRQTSYVKKFFVESPFLSEEDIKDTDIDILATNVRDLVMAVENQVDAQIYDIISESQSPSNILTTISVQDGWDDIATGDPILDILIGKRKIRQNRYNPEGAILYINSIENQHLINYLISVKGSSIPGFSSEKVKNGVVMEILGLNVVVSENANSDSVLMFVQKRACTWKGFMPLTSAVIHDPGIGKKIRVWEEGEALLTDPKAVHLTTDTIT